jgi:hypothetical protein
MRRVIAITVAGLSLAGCAGTWFPTTVDITLESTPPGADAITSLGPGCKTPCTVAVPSPTDDFSVSYTLKGFQPMTIPLHITRSVGGLMAPSFTTINPNPAVAQLEAIAPPPKRAKKKRAPAAQ